MIGNSPEVVISSATNHRYSPFNGAVVQCILEMQGDVVLQGTGRIYMTSAKFQTRFQMLKQHKMK